MIAISDTNIIYSCFQKPKGAIASILTNKKKNIQFIAPDYLLEEVKEHMPEIMKDNNLTKRQANKMLKEFIKNISFYKMSDIPSKQIIKAKKIVKNIDPDDYPFIALHLEEGHKIWTCDNVLSKGLKEIGYDICISTQDLRAYTYKKKTITPHRENKKTQKK